MEAQACASQAGEAWQASLLAKFNFIFDGGCAGEEELHSHYSGIYSRTAPESLSFFGFICSTLPSILDILFQFFELSTKAAFAKAVFDTLQPRKVFSGGGGDV